VTDLIDKMLSRILLDRGVDRIEITVTDGNVHVEAMPPPWGNVVIERYREAVKKAGSPVMSLAKATALRENCGGAIAHANGRTIEAALSALADALGKETAP
jgi:hypothetical protein